MCPRKKVCRGSGAGVTVKKNSKQTGDCDLSRESSGPSQLFLLRIWQREDQAADPESWHGKIQHPSSGEVRIFTSCGELRQAILDMMARESAGQLADES